MREFRVAWVVDVDAKNHEDAAKAALAMQRDPRSIATVFEVAPRCECGEYHADDLKTIDLMERTSAH